MSGSAFVLIFVYHLTKRVFQAGLQLGSSHAILVGDPQQLPATIFSMSGKKVTASNLYVTYVL